MLLAEYMRKHHPAPAKQCRVMEVSDFHPEFRAIPVRTITILKAFVLVGIMLAAVLPPQYAFWVILFSNGYWMFKL